MSDTTIFTQFIDDVRDDRADENQKTDQAPPTQQTDQPAQAPDIGALPFGDINEIVDSVDPERVVTKSDLNGDGNIDEISIDLDGDGIADVTISDYDNDVAINKIDYDADGDGEFDTRHHDFDGDGVVDSISIDPGAM